MKRINTSEEEERCYDDLSRMSEQEVELGFQSLHCGFKPHINHSLNTIWTLSILMNATDTPE